MKNPKKGLALFAASLIAASTLVACGPTESEVQKVNEPKQETQAKAPEAKEETKTEAAEEVIVEEAEEATDVYAKVGQTMQFDDLNVTLNQVRKAGGTNEWDQPEKDHYLIFDVTVENTGEEPYAMSSIMNFSTLDADGYAQDLSVFAETRGSLDGEIGPGRKLAGEIAFDVDASDSYEFIFEELFTQGQAIWQVNAADITE